MYIKDVVYVFCVYLRVCETSILLFKLYCIHGKYIIYVGKNTMLCVQVQCTYRYTMYVEIYDKLKIGMFVYSNCLATLVFVGEFPNYGMCKVATAYTADNGS